MPRKSDFSEFQPPAFSHSPEFPRMSSQIDVGDNSTPLRRRGPRISRACEQCRGRKVRCDGQRPCSGCQGGGAACLYSSGPRRRRVAGNSRNDQRQSRDKPTPINGTSSPGLTNVGPETPNVCHNPVQFKRLQELRAGIGISNSDTGAFQFYGPSSHFCFVQRIYQRISRKTHEPFLTPTSDPLPGGVQKWGLERFMFSVGADHDEGKCLPDAFFSCEMGALFLDAYFDVIHPQLPILAHAEILDVWNTLQQPPSKRKPNDREAILFMVFAIGSRVSSFEGKQDASSSEAWADYFFRKANDSVKSEDASLRLVHFYLLKAVYNYQVMRPNEAYILLGHAARIAHALGINRAQVTEGATMAMHRLRLTFWTVYSQERVCSLYAGRPSTFRDELIDTSLPEDPTFCDLSQPERTCKYMQPTIRCGMARAMASIAKISDRVLVEIYSRNILNTTDLLRVHQTALECDAELASVTRTLPPYLHFFDDHLPIGQGWQEVQRALLGCHYYLVRMLMHRPALVYATFYKSKAEAEDQAAGAMKVQESIDLSVSSAKRTVDLTYTTFFHRYPNVKFDGSLAAFLVSACVTLLYDVLDPETTHEYARDTFTVVDRGIECLDQIQHVGQTTGKALSLDVMKFAKDAFLSTQNQSILDDDLIGYFPWLHETGLRGEHADITEMEPHPFAENSSTATGRQNGDTRSDLLDSLIAAPEVNYVPHWLEAGFEQQDVPECLY
ncbi:hypothetical protein N7452_007931 [Penicillium brevicompactum]|uniref:Zn(2)-C6 fungal-type domain-containing protein n=1 Tax=Penicillium brevicompactum TaxID=5074 RepID=A0A9W9QGE7_PENBR|nr:hypothetical protein N7452_007931 [Penicillium brevicompactum]